MESEIRFLSYGDFIAQFVKPDRKLVVEKGIIALTETDLRLATEHYRYLFSKDLNTIPFQEMEGVSRIGSQIHIKHGGKEIVLEFNPGWSAYDDGKKSETAFGWLVGSGIPTYEVAESTVFPPYSWPSIHWDSYPARLRDDRYDSFYSYGEYYYWDYY